LDAKVGHDIVVQNSRKKQAAQLDISDVRHAVTGNSSFSRIANRLKTRFFEKADATKSGKRNKYSLYSCFASRNINPAFLGIEAIPIKAAQIRRRSQKSGIPHAPHGQ